MSTEGTAVIVAHVRTVNISGQPERPSIQIPNNAIGNQWDILVLKIDPKIIDALKCGIEGLNGSVLFAELASAARLVENSKKSGCVRDKPRVRGLRDLDL